MKKVKITVLKNFLEKLRQQAAENTRRFVLGECHVCGVIFRLYGISVGMVTEGLFILRVK